MNEIKKVEFTAEFDSLSEALSYLLNKAEELGNPEELFAKKFKFSGESYDSFTYAEDGELLSQKKIRVSISFEIKNEG